MERVGSLDILSLEETLRQALQNPPLPIEPAPPPKAPAVASPRTCVVCGETGLPFIRPCVCPSDYCFDCLHSRFIIAVEDKTLFPARCCTLLQLHTVLRQLSNEHAKKYRLLFEEWISPQKLYCPSQSCSSFIPDRTIEKAKTSSKIPSTVRQFLHGILLKMNASQSARFFREEPDITHLPGHTSVVEKPIYLMEMQAKLGEYTSAEQFTKDVQLILSNAHLHGSDHPIAKAASELFALYIRELSNSIEQLLSHHTSSIACPTCHIAICASCKQVEHTGACDNSKRDEELAMLAKFGYKQCPRCGHGVRKMFGCSHIVCRCGAGFCWNCTRSIDLCGGGCGSDEDEEDEEDEVDMDFDSEAEAEGGIPIPVALPTDQPNLDAGGDRRWMQENLDFGDEPEEDGAAQVWSCQHSWRKYRDPNDGFFHGDSQYMECNRCFKGCPRGKGASTCAACRLLVCSGCKESFKSSVGPER